MTTLKRLLSILWPPTKKKLHRLVSIVGTAFAAFAIVYAWAGQLGLGTSGKIAATLGMLATYAAAWNSVRPKIDASINGLPIPDDDVVVVKTETKTTVTRTPSDEAKTPALVTPRDKDGGKSVPSVFGLFLIVIALSFLAATAVNVAFERVARAGDATPQFGGCFSSGKACAGPSAAITVASFNLATSQFSGGVAPGLGYGVTYAPAEWYAVGVDLYASLRLGQGQPNQATFSLMAHFANYVFLGIGPSITQMPTGVPALVQWSVLGGFGVPIGGSTSYLAKAAKGVQ